MNTNNTIEAQNRLLKHSYLSQQKMSLSSLLSVLLRQFWPDNYEKYAAAQFRMTAAYRQYYSWVPEFLHQRPRPVMRIKNWKREVHWDRHTDIRWWSRPVQGILLQYMLEHCQDWLAYHLPCKHFYAVFKFKTEWSWDKLPKEYVNSPRLSFDKDVLQSAFKFVLDESARLQNRLAYLTMKKRV